MSAEGYLRHLRGAEGCGAADGAVDGEGCSIVERAVLEGKRRAAVVEGDIRQFVTAIKRIGSEAVDAARNVDGGKLVTIIEGTLA